MHETLFIENWYLISEPLLVPNQFTRNGYFLLAQISLHQVIQLHALTSIFHCYAIEWTQCTFM